MSLQFRPMPGLSVIVAIMLAILISLGIWQYQRLQWKTDLLAEVEASVTAPPLTSLVDLERAIEAGEPVDFRRIELANAVGLTAPEYHVFKSQSGGIFWDIFRPFGQNGQRAYIRTQTIEAEQKDSGEYEMVGMAEPAPIYGYVREDHPMGLIESWVKSKPNPSTNRWFKFNQDGSWDPETGESILLSHYIEREPAATSAENLPIRRPTIRNNHRDYMLTWFSFAGLLIIFYLLIHKRAGRLSW